jgi:hypothetical protein
MQVAVRLETRYFDLCLFVQIAMKRRDEMQRFVIGLIDVVAVCEIVPLHARYGFGMSLFDMRIVLPQSLAGCPYMNIELSGTRQR